MTALVAAPSSAFVPFAIPKTALASLAKALEKVDRPDLFDMPAPSSADDYTRRVIVDTPDLLVIAARWRAGGGAELHGHSDSAGLYRVVVGAVEEQRYLPIADGLEYSSSVLETDDETYLPAGAFHQLVAREDSITIHAYSPRPDDSRSDLTPLDRVLIDRARLAANATD